MFMFFVVFQVTKGIINFQIEDLLMKNLIYSSMKPNELKISFQGIVIFCWLWPWVFVIFDETLIFFLIFY